ncbi:MAG: hypothetical protein M1819_003532 [Sarea resinae]|nr:MAG: hypothetical protein M1819_003532 [Sarea resinae]
MHDHELLIWHTFVPQPISVEQKKKTTATGDQGLSYIVQTKAKSNEIEPMVELIDEVDGVEWREKLPLGLELRLRWTLMNYNADNRVEVVGSSSQLVHDTQRGCCTLLEERTIIAPRVLAWLIKFKDEMNPKTRRLMQLLEILGSEDISLEFIRDCQARKPTNEETASRFDDKFKGD